MKYPYPLVVVYWRDAAFHKGWYQTTQRPVVSNTRTVGYLVEDTDGQILIAMNTDDEGRFADAMAIPRSEVQQVRRLRAGKRLG